MLERSILDALTKFLTPLWTVHYFLKQQKGWKQLLRERENDTKTSYFKSSSSIFSYERVKLKLLRDQSGLPLKALLQNKTLSSMKIFFTSNSHLVSNKKTKSVGMFEIKQYRKIKILLGYQTQKSLPKNTPRVFQVETMQKRPWCVFCVVCA